MDAPKGRYRVEERDGRLIVIDGDTGAPAASSSPSAARGGRPGAAPAPIVAGKGAIDGAADLLLGLAVKEWDADGRAVIRWKWENNGQARHWDALLDQGQQRRLGRALLGFAGLPLLLLLVIAGVPFWIGIPLALPGVAWGAFAIARLRSETAGQPPPAV